VISPARCRDVVSGKEYFFFLISKEKYWKKGMGLVLWSKRASGGQQEQEC